MCRVRQEFAAGIKKMQAQLAGIAKVLGMKAATAQ